MKKKFIITTLSLVCVLACAFALAACGVHNKPSAPTHTHLWSQTYEYNDTHHWHVCEESGCDITDNSQKDGYAEHDYSKGDCVCYKPYSEHLHTWSQEYTTSENYHWYKCTVPLCAEKKENAKHNFVDGKCVCGLSASLKYKLNDDKESYSITNIGTINDKDITIPSEIDGKPVTSIGREAFRECKNIESVVLPSSVSVIDDSAFYGCTNLKTINIPDGVKEIAASAFSNCSALTSIELPDGITKINTGAFTACSSLQSVEFPESLTNIGILAFSRCGSLTSIVIPNNVVLENSAFSSCSALKEITIGDGVTGISSTTFRECPIEKATIPADIMQKIYTTVQKTIKTIIISSGESIGQSAFGGLPKLESITISKSVTSIGAGAFVGCSKLTNIFYKGTQEEWNAISKTNWDVGFSTEYVIHCTDGDIAKEN